MIDRLSLLFTQDCKSDRPSDDTAIRIPGGRGVVGTANESSGYVLTDCAIRASRQHDCCRGGSGDSYSLLSPLSQQWLYRPNSDDCHGRSPDLNDPMMDQSRWPFPNSLGSSGPISSRARTGGMSPPHGVDLKSLLI